MKRKEDGDRGGLDACAATVRRDKEPAVPGGLRERFLGGLAAAQGFITVLKLRAFNLTQETGHIVASGSGVLLPKPSVAAGLAGHTAAAPHNLGYETGLQVELLAADATNNSIALVPVAADSSPGLNRRSLLVGGLVLLTVSHLAYCLYRAYSFYQEKKETTEEAGPLGAGKKSKRASVPVGAKKRPEGISNSLQDEVGEPEKTLTIEDMVGTYRLESVEGLEEFVTGVEGSQEDSLAVNTATTTLKVEYEDGWWTFTFCLVPGQEEEVERFRSGESFTRTSSSGTQFNCKVDVKGNVFHYTCRGPDADQSYWGTKTFSTGQLMFQHYLAAGTADACLTSRFSKMD